MLALEVKGKRDLAESLQAFIAGENVAYSWNSEPPRDTMMRSSIRDLPPHLILSLQRYDFDFETFTRVKLTSRLEFPLELDMFPYTDVGRPDRGPGTSSVSQAGAVRPPEYYRFELGGVLIHVGSASAGHYYTLVRDRGSGAWRECNDSRVSPFDPASIPREAFGGDDHVPTPTAVALFYDRIGQDGPGRGEGAVCDLADEGPPATLVARLATRDAAQRALSGDCDIPAGLLQAVWEDNEEFWRESAAFDPAYLRFVKALTVA